MKNYRFSSLRVWRFAKIFVTLQKVKNKNMVSKLTKEHDRRSKLCDYLYGVSNLMISGVGIAALSPFITGKEMAARNFICAAIGSLAAIGFAYCANRIMKYNDNN